MKSGAKGGPPATARPPGSDEGGAVRLLVVTGARGQVGRAVVRRARARGMPVRALAREALDIADRAAVVTTLASLPPGSVVVNAAAFTDVDGAEGRSDEAFRVNRDGPAWLAAACRRAGAALVHLSTDYVFDGRTDAPYDELAEPAPLQVYGRSKLAGEAAVAAILPAHAIVRTAWVFGPDGRNFLHTMLRLARERGTVDVVADQQGCPTGAAHVAEAALALAGGLAAGERRARGIFHVAGRPCVSRAAFARRIFDEARAVPGLPVARVHEVPASAFPSEAARPGRVVLASRRTGDVAGLEPLPWEGYLAATLRELGRRQTGEVPGGPRVGGRRATTGRRASPARETGGTTS